MPGNLPAIRPGDIDAFTFDFAARIGRTGAITDAAWICSLAQYSIAPDPFPETRVIDPPENTPISTRCKYGTMIEDCTYLISVTVDLDDGRRFSDERFVACTYLHDVSDDTAAFTIEQFRAEFPAFANAVAYPDAQVRFWIDQAVDDGALDPYRWGQFYNLGLRLYVAHNLAIAGTTYPANGGLAPGGSSALGSGLINSKSVGGVSISYDNTVGMEENAGWWGLTVWGNQFLYYARQAGQAPIQL